MGRERTVRLRIAGAVQGVGYRYWTERTAHELGLSGWVRNRRDGTVEAVISGSAEMVDRMIERCRKGPRAARVTSIDVEEEPATPSSGFEVLPTA